ncbi:sirohydrochlorin chelatase [Streptomyces bathyalis]|uniref:Sirohydrochlorin chelatase n=1 Tax=Streptomyces bathyalis TaxID=2710756 RepID=A0A7T1WST5_9ACTN|nr:sirohydrochlorin chelatase [Streptomyces bathyalis]QPP09503.1 sirohydrochlorin chelatase [Streptomyces bathyalis]
MTQPPALLLVGHGTRDDEDAEDFRSFVGEIASRSPEIPVAGGSLELSPPLTDSVAELVGRGVTDFVAVPLMLVSDGRAQGDIPAALAREEERHPGTSLRCARPLGPHPQLLSLLERRVEEALDGGTGTEGPAPRSPGDRAGTTVLLVGRGSTDPHANAEVHRTARLLWEGRGYAGVEVAFVSLAAPDVASGLDRCRKLGAKKVVILPYVLFAGVLTERAAMHAEGWSAANPEVEVVDAKAMGATDELADVVMEHYREAAGVTPPGPGDATGHPRPSRPRQDEDGHGHGRSHDADSDAHSH